ncbi:MAG: amidase, partial [Pseudomonadota bacterium]
MSDPALLALTEAAAEMAAGRLSSVELTQACLERTQATEAALNAYVVQTPEAALKAAHKADAERASGQVRGPLHGVPVAVKDLIDMAGLVTTCSSAVRRDFPPAHEDAAVVARLKDAGAVIVGKTHTHEFAYGIATPTTRNPWDTARIPGGSSGGSAASVAVGGCAMGIGSDTGGSIRIPAALCGLVGLKPTYGRVSRAGVASLSWSLDHVGPLTRTVADAALCLDAMAGFDARDPASLDVACAAASELGQGVKGLRIGWPSDYFLTDLQPAVAEAAAKARDRLASEGAEIVEVAIPHADLILAVEYALCLPEASSYHYETIRSRPHLYNEDVRIFLEAGALLPASVYLQAQRARLPIKAGFAALFEGIDALLAPTVAATAVPCDTPSLTWESGREEPLNPVYVRFSAPANVTGLPSISVPAGCDGQGLPIGVQIMGPALSEARICRIAQVLERLEPMAS